MIGNLVKKLVGSRNDRTIKQLSNEVSAINAHEPAMQALSDADLAAKTEEFRTRLADGATLESILPEAFAVVREAGSRAMEMRHFDVQMIGGMVLNSGRIAEMRTGEGKTLVATTAVYLNALAGHGVHVITVNDYLAQRDSDWMGQLYRFLGLTVGVIVSNLPHDERRAAYAADVTYGTNNEFGFDYLRDNMALSPEQKVQRGLNFAIVDEVDSILIDEARTPLIISGPADSDSNLYGQIDALIPQLQRQQEEEGDGHFSVDEKAKQVHLTEQGHDHVEELLIGAGLLEEGESLYDPSKIILLHHLNAAMRAHALFQRNVDYIVKDNQIVIVDEFTGRTMAGRRWSDGLHQAIEAKERVEIQRENQTLASITFQNYFRLYNKLAGMTGTADTEAFEFQQIYGLEVVVIPTHREMIRDDRPDLVYLTQEEKYESIIEDIVDCVSREQPVLVGTTSIETSEYLAGLLAERDIPHEILNAKQHEREAQIIANAGQPGAVTIATNMAGRGTDIVLGGNVESELEALDEGDTDAADQIQAQWRERHDQVLNSGGLHIIGTERHESRRIDNQLRGRSGRQGDAGSSRFYLSLEDSLMRIFASERMGSLMQKLGMEEGEAIEHPWVTKAIENAQRKVEGHNFDIRKHLLEYDDVANDQRKVVYEQRDEYMLEDDAAETIDDMREDVIGGVIDAHIPADSMEEMWDLDGLVAQLELMTGDNFDIHGWLEAEPEIPIESIKNRVLDTLEQNYREKEQKAGVENLRQFEKAIVLQKLDEHWKEHLAGMDYLRQSVGLRGYAQKNPKQEYKREAYELFTRMLEEYKSDVITLLSRVRVEDPAAVEQVAQEHEERARQQEVADVTYQHADAVSALDDNAEEADTGAVGGQAAAQGTSRGASQGASRGASQATAQQQAAQRQSAQGTAQGAAQGAAQPPAKPFVRGERKMGRNEPCYCGSGKKFKQCHGKLG